MGDQALLVIDMLKDFIDEGGSLDCGPSARAIVAPIQKRIRAARERGWPVIYIRDQHRPDDREFEAFQPHCIAGSEGAEVIGELAPEPGDHVIGKRRFSGFFGTDLDLTLREHGIREVHLVGVCTQICVLYTAADASMLGYDVVVYRDEVASFDMDAHTFALSEIEHTLGARIE